MYSLSASALFLKQLRALDKGIKAKLKKKLEKVKTEKKRRHLKAGFPYFVEEVGQYRIVYSLVDQEILLLFVGDHKEYERYYSSIF